MELTIGCTTRPHASVTLAEACERVPGMPVLLERDFNFPPLAELLAELDHVRAIQAAAGKVSLAG